MTPDDGHSIGRVGEPAEVVFKTRWQHELPGTPEQFINGIIRDLSQALPDATSLVVKEEIPIGWGEDVAERLEPKKGIMADSVFVTGDSVTSVAQIKTGEELRGILLEDVGIPYMGFGDGTTMVVKHLDTERDGVLRIDFSERKGGWEADIQVSGNVIGSGVKAAWDLLDEVRQMPARIGDVANDENPVVQVVFAPREFRH